MCALGHYLELAGFSTTGISLVRENAESLQPPRTLWVSFPLGRPLGVPKDAAFQHRVIAASLALLSEQAGPVLADYPEDAPSVATETSPACPVSFQQTDNSWRGRLLAELGDLAPWYEIGRDRRDGRTLVGVSDTSMEEIISRLGDDLDAQSLPQDLKWFKSAIEDAKAYYVEAITAQPGSYDHTQIYRTIWHDTQLGAGLRWFYDEFEQHPTLSAFSRIVLPRSAISEDQQ